MDLSYEEWRQARKGIKRRMSTSGWALLIYFAIMNVSVFLTLFIGIMISMVGGIASGDSTAVENAVMQAAENAWGYFLAAAVGFVLLLVWKKPRFLRKEIFARGAPMKVGDFFTILCIFLSGQMVFQLGTSLLETILNAFGYTIAPGLESMQTDPGNLSMFLYAGILAPVTEEILFRGLIQRTMLPFGKKFAIFVSALTFGLFHGNLLQTPYAFAVGLVLGYVAAEYNIVWAMVLHMINNLVLGDLIYRLMIGLPQNTADWIVWGIILAFTVAAVILLIVKRRKIAAWLRKEKTVGAYVGCYFSCAGTIVLLLVLGANTVLSTWLMIAPL